MICMENYLCFQWPYHGSNGDGRFSISKSSYNLGHWPPWSELQEVSSDLYKARPPMVGNYLVEVLKYSETNLWTQPLTVQTSVKSHPSVVKFFLGTSSSPMHGAGCWGRGSRNFRHCCWWCDPISSNCWFDPRNWWWDPNITSRCSIQHVLNSCKRRLSGYLWKRAFHNCSWDNWWCYIGWWRLFPTLLKLTI